MIQKFIFAAVLFAGVYAMGADHMVTMKSISFDPKKIEIKAGDSVEWTNKSYTDHSATSNTGEFDTGKVNPHANSKKVTFSKPGTFPYHCSIHGMTMSGQVIVKP